MLKRLIVTAFACLVVAACVSQFAESYVGKTTTDLELDLGKPANIVEMPDGRRSYQYYWGGGTFELPQTSSGTVSVTGNTAYVTSQTFPAAAVSSDGCLVNFIAEQQNDQWVIVESRWPGRLIC